MGVDWSSIFVPHGSLLEVVLRGTLMYLGLFLVLRFLLRRQTGGLGVSDVLVIVVLADAAQNGMAGDYRSVTEGFVLVLTVVFWDYVIDWLGYESTLLKRFARPKHLQLVVDGELIRENLAKEKITVEELMSQLRLQGVADAAQVKAAYIEGDGRISVIRRDSDASPQTGAAPAPLP
ncbi:MAG: DUF421 domain-containing protein [Methylobacteriaceae bacterium]|nr:DUF421 domain-containing protein [Methylobacteriaceae bacterium]